MIPLPPIPKNITTILWDMDGVLVNSEEIWEQNYPKFLEEAFGISEFKTEDYDLVLGKTPPKAYESLCKPYPKLENYTKEDFIKAENEYALNHIYPNTILYPEIQKLLERSFSQGLKMGIVSSSPSEWIEVCVQKHNLKKYFEILVSGFEEHISKPNPQIYLLASRLLKEDPKNCLVIEDSPSGIQAGKKAGMSVWGFKNSAIQPV